MLLIKPFLGCNLACKYCYEGNYRKKTKPQMAYNLEAILKRMEEFKNLEMSLHGGEALAMPKKDVAAILEKMYELKGKSAIQTNGTLIDDEYIEMFKKYKTSVGISYDGPDDLSEFRPGSSDVDKTIEKLIAEKLNVSLIMVLSKANAGTDEKLTRLKDYLLELNKMKICGRINPCAGAKEYELDEKRMQEAYLDLARFCLENNLKWSPFVDLIHGLQGKNRVCIFMGCDPFHTQSATVIVDDGSVTNCMRLNQEEILLRHPIQHNTRVKLLDGISQEFGGCQGCKYWNSCYGGCPSSAINDDWRNRTYLCPLWKALFKYYEKVLSAVEYPNILPDNKNKDLSINKNKECSAPEKKGDGQSGWQHLDHQDSNPAKDYEDGHGDTPHTDWQDHADE